MHRPVRLSHAIVLTVTVALLGLVPMVARASGPQHVLVRLEDGAAPEGILQAIEAAGGNSRAVFTRTVDAVAATVPAALADRLADDPRVAAVEVDRPVRAFQTVQAPTGVRRIGADAYGPADIDGDGSQLDVDVAVLDTGIAAHPDLRIAGSVDCLSGSCVTSAPADPHSHGTHVAGTVAALDDGTGVVGVAPGARLHDVRVLAADGSGSLSTLLAGLEWLRANAATVEVANLSLGCACRSTTLDQAVTAVAEAGVTLVVAAGNEATDAGGYSPANHPDVVAVAAMSDFDGQSGRSGAAGCVPDPDDSFASYSNYGSVVDVVAPGSCITSTMPGGSYARKTGTSMATPHVAGAAALHIVTAGLAQSSSRAAEVKDALTTEHAVAVADDCGYVDSVSVAPMLHLTCVGVPVNAAPTLEVSSPEDGTTVVSGSQVALRASAQDAEDGELSGEIVWTSSVSGRLGTGPEVRATLAEVGNHTIVASVTDSSGDNTRVSRLVQVTTASGSTGAPPAEEPAVPAEPEPEEPPTTDKEPQLRVVAPVPEGRIVAGVDAQLVARAVDAEDGDVRTWVKWRSDVDGSLGAGGSLTVQLSRGTHRITASVVDSDGNLVERSVVVAVDRSDALSPRPIVEGCPPSQVPDAGFRDVDEDSPFAAAIDCIVWWDVARGTDPDRYSPAAPVTRGQMAQFLAAAIRASGGSLPAPERDFFEDDDGGMFEPAINTLAAAGVVQGFTETTYGPTRKVTRGQMATFVARTYEQRASLALPGIQPRFADVAQPHAPNIHAVAAAGIAAGVSGDTYDPEAVVSRGQMAAFIARALDLLVDTAVTSPPG